MDEDEAKVPQAFKKYFAIIGTVLVCGIILLVLTLAVEKLVMAII